MFYQNLFKRPADHPVRACLLGAGEFGASFLFQARDMPHMEVPAVCTRTVQRAVDALADAGIPAAKVRICDTADEAQKFYAEGYVVVVDSFEKLTGLPLDVLVESSGAPETSAAAAEMAINHGMHVVMVSKETESVVGSILARKAQARGLVFTTGDGDQPSMLIGLISWARALGLTVVGAGKSSEYDFVFDPEKKRLVCEGQKTTLDVPGLTDQWLLGDRPAIDVVNARATLLSELSMRSVPDLCEMTVVANATGLVPDRPLFHAPVARMQEMPDLFCPKADGGLFDAPGKLDIFNCLRRPDEVSMAGGEFIVVECKDKKSWKVLEAKGHPVSRNGKYAAIYIPRHLLGVETGTTVLAAATMGHATGGDNLRPICDLQGRATRDLKAGHLLQMGGHHHTIDGVDAVIETATPVGPGSPLPFYLFSNLPIVRDVPAGKLICYEDVQLPVDSVLLRLRKEQDEIFGLTK
jgi:predicted homoserine dehydrogenase-like protein